MTSWKFLLYGITGDLAKKKILPALAQFAELHKDNLQIELTGYSRSVPDNTLIESILNSSTKQDQHYLKSINYIQGDYADSKVFFDFIGDLQKDERLVTYLAIPPELFVNILKNSCPFSNNPIDIIIEKPFGRDLNEAQQILNIIDVCDLHHRIHFLDHYLFKTSTFISSDEWKGLADFESKTIKKITLQALENIDVKDRGGYYNDIGCLKDIFVHLFSLLELVLSYFQKPYNYDKFVVKNLLLGQYESYLRDINKSESITDTYFKVDSEIMLSQKQTQLSFESGKKLDQKATSITIDFEDGSELIWKIAPESKIEFFALDEHKSIDLAKNNRLDHTNLFNMLLSSDNSRFIDNQNILTNWQLFEKITDFKIQNNILPKNYLDNIYPLQFINEV